MLDILLTKTDQHFRVFCDLLSKNGMSHLVPTACQIEVLYIDLNCNKNNLFKPL